MTDGLTPRAEVLREAERLVVGDRDHSYGSPTDNFTHAANLWSVQFAHLLKPGAKFGPEHVAEALILVKLGRNVTASKRDNWVDIAGYAACGYETTVKTPEPDALGEFLGIQISKTPPIDQIIINSSGPSVSTWPAQ